MSGAASVADHQMLCIAKRHPCSSHFEQRLTHFCPVLSSLSGASAQIYIYIYLRENGQMIHKFQMCIYLISDMYISGFENSENLWTVL